MIEERIGAFIEYTLRPLTEDIKIICEKLKELDIKLDEASIRRVLRILVNAHLVGEFLRVIGYIIISGMACYTVIKVLH